MDAVNPTSETKDMKVNYALENSNLPHRQRDFDIVKEVKTHVNRLMYACCELL